MPPVLINPHELRHIDTAHPSTVRVYVFGSSALDVNTIIPESVQLGGASPNMQLFRDLNGDGNQDTTFFFRGDEISLPRGFTQATLTGTTTDGQTFSSSQRVFNRDLSFFSPGTIAAQQRRGAARAASPVAFEAPRERPTVAIRQRQAAVADSPRASGRRFATVGAARAARAANRPAGGSAA